MKYSTAATFGRFNIPHMGHVDLISRMLQRADNAHVHVSTGGDNNSWDLRILMLRHLCRNVSLDLERVSFFGFRLPFRAIRHSISLSPYGEVVVVLGRDQEFMLESLSNKLDTNYLLNERLSSSTEIRFLLDHDPKEAVRMYNGDSYSVRLAKLLRQEEKQRGFRVRVLNPRFIAKREKS